MPQEGHHTGEERDGHIAPVADSFWRDRADQHIAGEATSIARCKRQHQYTEQIEPLLDPDRRAAERKHERADKVEHQQRARRICRKISRG